MKVTRGPGMLPIREDILRRMHVLCSLAAWTIPFLHSLLFECLDRLPRGHAVTEKAELSADLSSGDEYGFGRMNEIFPLSFSRRRRRREKKGADERKDGGTRMEEGTERGTRKPGPSLRPRSSALSTYENSSQRRPSSPLPPSSRP